MRTRIRRLPAPATVVALAVFVAAAAWLFSDALLGGRYLTANAIVFSFPPFEAHRPAGFTPSSDQALDDITYIFQPFLYHARAAFRAGHIPVWNSYVGAGRPLGAQQAAQLFPTNWPSYVLGFWRSIVVDFALTLVLAALGTYAFCRRLRLRPGPAIFAALAFAFGNPFVPFLGHGHTKTYLMLPVALMAIDRLAERISAIDIALLGVALGIAFYGGHPESWAIAGLLAAAYAVFKLIIARRRGLPRAAQVRAAAAMLGGALLAGCVGALSLLPLLELFTHSIHLDRAVTSAESIKHLAVGAVAPEFWGRHDKHVFIHESISDIASIYQGRPYLGVLPLVFSVCTVGLRRRPERWFFVGVAVVSLMALMLHPVRVVAHEIPGLSRVSLHELVWPLSFSGAIVSGFGLQWCLEASHSGKRRLLIGCAAFATAAALALVASRPQMLASAGDAVQQFPTLRKTTTSADAAALGATLRFAVLAAIGVGVGAIALLRFRSPRAFVAICIAATAADLVTLGRGFFATADLAVAHPPLPPSIARVRDAGPDARLIGVGAAFEANLSDYYGVLDARVQDLPEVERYTRLFSGLGGFAEPGFGRTSVVAGSPSVARVSDVFAARYVLDGGGSRPPAGMRSVYARPGERLMENRDAFPRAWVAYGWQRASGFGPALHVAVTSAPAKLLRTPVIEGAGTSSSRPPPPTPATILHATDTSVRVAVNAHRPGYLVLDDTYYPGWHARVDGRPVPVRAANVAFRAVRVRPGRRIVTFRYDPTSVRLGKLLTLAALAAIAVLFGVAAAQRVRAPSGRPSELA